MPKDIQRDITVVKKDDSVIYTSEQSQEFNPEDFVQVYNDTVGKLEMIRNQRDDTQEKIQDILDEYEEEMKELHTLLKNEPQNGDEVLPNSIEAETVDKYQELQELKDKKNGLEKQISQVRSQIDRMKEVAEEIAEEQDLEIKEP